MTEKTGGTLTMQATYAYDALGRRIRTRVDDDGAGPHAAVTTWTAYDGENPYADFNSGGTLTMRYLHGLAIDALLARTESGGTSAWYLPDRLGTVRDIVSTAGGAVWHGAYAAFGSITSETGTGDRFTFTGRERNAETGDYYFRARHLDAWAGRFTSLDPIGFMAQDVNFFRYVTNNPLNAVDPLGLYGESQQYGRQDKPQDEPYDPIAEAIDVLWKPWEGYGWVETIVVPNPFTGVPYVIKIWHRYFTPEEEKYILENMLGPTAALPIPPRPKIEYYPETGPATDDELNDPSSPPEFRPPGDMYTYPKPYGPYGPRNPPIPPKLPPVPSKPLPRATRP